MSNKNSNSINDKNNNKSKRSYNNKVIVIRKTIIIREVVMNKNLAAMFTKIQTTNNEKESIYMKMWVLPVIK